MKVTQRSSFLNVSSIVVSQDTAMHENKLFFEISAEDVSLQKTVATREYSKRLSQYYVGNFDANSIVCTKAKYIYTLRRVPQENHKKKHVKRLLSFYLTENK